MPRRFVVFTTLTVGTAAGSVAGLAAVAGWHVRSPARFAVLALFVLAGELLPVPVPCRHGLDKVTTSTAFAFATLLFTGALPACLVYATASVVADLSTPTTPIKVLFNAAQYVVSLAGAAVVLMAVHAPPPVTLHAAAVPPILLAAVACFAINHVLAGTGAALLVGLPIRAYLREDAAFHTMTAGCLLALSPGVVASADHSITLIPIAFVPVLAIYIGGRQTALNAHRAFHDSLTDLPNRALLTEAIAAALSAAEHTGSALAVMIVDLDDFKSINDTLGHQFGDQVLKLIAPRLADALGPRGLVARLGGDEFAAVIPRVKDAEDAMRCGETLLSTLERACEVDSLVLQVGGSIGVACYPEHGATASELLQHADVALYCAKAERSTCVLYEHELDAHSVDRLALAAQLRRGIERGELVVHFQPKAPLTPHAQPGVEALVRWNHPELGLIGPDAFVPLAEQTGLLKALTGRVMDAALAQCRAWRAAGRDIRVSVNISTRSLLDHDLTVMIRSLLERYAVPPASLQIEITESRFVADLVRARTVLHELRATGVTIAIDDFGTGFSSLAQLQQLPVDEIKIDRSFVTRMEVDRDDGVLVRSIIELGRNLGLRVTAEGVETVNVYRTLCELGCDYAQGFLVGRPVPADECTRALESMRREPLTWPRQLVAVR